MLRVSAKLDYAIRTLADVCRRRAQHDQRAERERLGDRRQPAHHARRHDDGERAAGGQQVGEDRRVERLHEAEVAGSASGMWCTEIRLRNTQ